MENLVFSTCQKIIQTIVLIILKICLKEIIILIAMNISIFLLNTEIAISDVLLTVRLQNALGKFYSNEDYSLENHEFFNPMSSLLTFGIIWEFDD